METTNKSNVLNLDKDAFSSGQISSKLWLCQELENLNISSVETAIYGGWYGLTAFLLLSRQRYQVERIRSYDIDPTCETAADLLNENWVWQEWKFKAHTADCNFVQSAADVIINTSTEHFSSSNWFENISTGTIVALQGNNMPHDDHTMCSETLAEFCHNYKLQKTFYEGQLDFIYSTWSFSRFMVIGIK